MHKRGRERNANGTRAGHERDTNGDANGTRARRERDTNGTRTGHGQNDIFNQGTVALVVLIVPSFDEPRQSASVLVPEDAKMLDGTPQPLLDRTPASGTSNLKVESERPYNGIAVQKGLTKPRNCPTSLECRSCLLRLLDACHDNRGKNFLDY